MIDDLPDDETERSGAQATSDALLARLCRQSVAKQYDPYRDIDWDAPEHRIDPTDPRFELRPDESLGATAWYRALPPATRARLGLHVIASSMKVGLQFEGVLKRGLLELAATLPDASPDLRYVYHEVVEEARHALMFREFIARTGLSVRGIVGPLARAARFIPTLGRRFPELFFVFVLGGEDPIDHVQRSVLDSGRQVHPLLRRVMKIHITEEARHLAFARDYLRRTVPSLSRARRLALSIAAPLILAKMARMMLRPPSHVIDEYRIPASVIEQAFTGDHAQRMRVAQSLRKVRSLLVELGIVDPLSRRLWRATGTWDGEGAAP
jgi:hypothetical protein